MKQNTINKETEQKKLNEWNSLADDLNALLHLEAAVLKDEFENQKNHLKVWLEYVNDWVSNVKDVSEEKKMQLKSSVQKLRDQVAAGKADTEDALIEQQQNISNGIEQLKINITEVYGASKTKIGNFAGEAADKLDDFHTRFDLFRLQFYLGKEEAKEDWEQKKKEISNQLQKIKLSIANGYEDRADNWDHFSDEMTDAWMHIKNAFRI
ncbi:MAG: hypothetical protein KQI35_17395 [Bacteroidetes bacterium]|nr:hypothetical protein [Bacteroidota bacterium]